MAVYDQSQAFDFPDPAVANGDRMGTTVASQALFMMNGPLMRSAPEDLAKQLLAAPGFSDPDRMQQASMRILGRPASDQEIFDWASFLERYQAADSVKAETNDARRIKAWQGLFRAMLSSNEFIYVD